MRSVTWQLAAAGLVSILVVATAHARTASVRDTRLVVESDHPCQLRIDGREQGEVAPGKSLHLNLDLDEVFVECQSERFQDLRHEEVYALPKLDRAVLSIVFGDAVRDAEEKLARQQTRFQSRSDGVFDKQQGLVWARAESDKALNWQQAHDYCPSLGSGWQLPSVAQLESLAHQDAPLDFGVQYQWSNKRVDTDRAIAVRAKFGMWSVEKTDRPYAALCVLISE